MIHSAKTSGQSRREFVRKAAVAGAGLPLAGSILPANEIFSPSTGNATIASNGMNERSGGEPWSINLFSQNRFWIISQLAYPVKNSFISNYAICS